VLLPRRRQLTYTHCADHGKPETRPPHRAASALPPSRACCRRFRRRLPSPASARPGVGAGAVQVPWPSGALQRPRAIGVALSRPCSLAPYSLPTRFPTRPDPHLFLRPLRFPLLLTSHFPSSLPFRTCAPPPSLSSLCRLCALCTLHLPVSCVRTACLYTAPNPQKHSSTGPPPQFSVRPCCTDCPCIYKFTFSRFSIAAPPPSSRQPPPPHS
jgi:hypothetical protein